MQPIRCFFFLLFSYCIVGELYVANSPELLWMGRIQPLANGSVQLDWSGVQVQFYVFNTTTVQIYIQDANNYFNVFVDGVFNSILGPTETSKTQYSVVSDLNANEKHLIKITKRTEAEVNSVAVLVNGIEVDGKILNFPFVLPSRKLEFLGDSITCGYGNEANQTTCVTSPEGILENNYDTWGGYLSRYFDGKIQK